MDGCHTPAEAFAPLPEGYRPRRPEATPFYALVREDLETMLERARDRTAHGFGLPRHVEGEFRRYLECGVLAHGFARVRCGTCKHEHLVAFSCKRRVVCPSCAARRASDTAARLVDHVLPAAPARQWVFTFPSSSSDDQ